MCRGAFTNLLLVFSFLLSGSAVAQGYPPHEATLRMALPDDLQVKLVASEPMIAQPVCIEFDDRGRLWVIQYLQYPNPAGLKRRTVDRWSRTHYDRVPEPPPHGPKGVDRITILEDPNGDGVADRSHDFVNGLNLATGLAFGHGGVFVLNVPYLLFYPDRNGDDIPDSDPIVCLSGFGMEDAHSVANSLTWGPDGWLYGCQGSTVTSVIRGVEFQQGVWRYHPLTREFELFCEGGGNSWGLDFDASGELIYSTNVGPYRNLHGVQGAYYWKSFGKHGGLHNPYAFGYFDHIPHTNFTGGHVTDGGIVYSGTNLPPRFRGRYIAGDLLGHGVQWHELYPRGSTFTSSHGGYLLAANDSWFSCTDVTMAPDGSVCVADWFDARTAHPDPDAEWDRRNGRIYRIAAKGAQPAAIPDLRKLSTTQLIGLLGNPNQWFSKKACRLLADRRDPEAILPLRTLILESKNDRLALEALWGLYVSGGFSEAFAMDSLGHRSAPVRKWTVRLLGDEKRVSPTLVSRLTELARTEPDVSVRAQLASSALRLRTAQGMPLVETLLIRDVDGYDPFVPLLLWWAVEAHSIQALPKAVAFFTSPEAWRSGILRDVIQERLMRRWIAEGSRASHDAAARLLASAPDVVLRQRLLAAIEQGFHDRPSSGRNPGGGGLFANTAMTEIVTNISRGGVRSSSPALVAEIGALWRDDTMDPVLLCVASRIGHTGAGARARTVLSDPAASPEVRVSLARLIGELGNSADVALLLKILGSAPRLLQLAALSALQTFDDPQIAVALLQGYASFADRVRASVREVLLSRRAWARELLLAVDAGRVSAGEFTVEQLRVVVLHADKPLDDLVKKHWGSIKRGTEEEKLAEMRRHNNDLNAGKGDPVRGRPIFVRLCGVCHSMFNEGGKVGPDLTFANRTDREFLLASLVDPSAAIRKEFLAYEIETNDGRILSGILADQSAGNLTLVSSAGERVVLSQSTVASLRESTVSLMPESLIKPLSPQELRDLFGFLQIPNQTPSKP